LYLATISLSGCLHCPDVKVSEKTENKHTSQGMHKLFLSQNDIY